MKSSANEATAKNCPTCSRPLPAGAPAGLCPACLLAQGAETESGAGGPQTRFVPPPLAEIAALFPQLEILRLLGAGGMGAVYQARQPALDRFVALKVLPAGGAGANFEERFNREARALARPSHPNIVAVHEFGQAGALHYFLMEYVDGANLRQLEQASRLSAREALQLIPQICDALQYAHDEGVVHRDIKPENVLVDRKGRVKIADFGLAKILGHDPEAARLTVEGQVMGTPHYMAPEQVECPLAVDHRADIYSLGVVFYEMLTGDLPLGKFAPPSRKVQVDVRLDEIVLQFSGLGRDTVERIEFESALGSSGISGADEVVRDGKSLVTDARRYLVSFPAGLRTTTIRIAWGMADWETTLSMSAPNWRESPPGGVSNSKWRLKFVGQPAMTGGQLQVSYLCGQRNPLWSHNLVAIDRQGREHDSKGGTGTGVGSDQDTVWTMHFRGLDLADVKEFRLQSRPIQWVEFANVALNPMGPLPRREPLRLAEPIDRTFDELIDFDTGRTATFPVAVPAANPFASIGENILWAQENGFDAVAGRGELQVADADFAPLSNADWDTLTAQEVINRLHRGTFHPRTLKELRPGEFPATYAYRTREQGYGMIQLVAFDPERPGATVRLKRVVRPGGSPLGSSGRPPAAALELRSVLPADDTATPFDLLTTAEGQPLRVAKAPWLRGDAFAGASWRMDPVSNARVIVLRLSDSGRRAFARLSAEHVREQVALVLAGRILFAPQIAAPMDVATLDLGGLDRERGQFVELLAALNPQPAAGPVRFGDEHEAVLTKSGGGTLHWWNLAQGGEVSVGGLEPLWAKMAANPIPAEARKGSASGLDRSTREYHEFRRAMGGDLEALGGNPMPVVSGQDLTVVPLAGDGQPPTALEIAYRWELLHQEPEPENLLSTGTYALRTRRGFTGILEVLGWNQDQTGVRIRYREVHNANAAL